jgi:hypothetical protein
MLMDLDDRAAAFRFPLSVRAGQFTTSFIGRWPRRCASVRFWHAGATNPCQQEGVMADPDEWDQESGQLGAEDTLDDRGSPTPSTRGSPRRSARGSATGGG